jgi:hypothetical protein
VREIRLLRAMWRALETDLRNFLNGHEGGNAGYSQGRSYGFTRQRSTLPGSSAERIIAREAVTKLCSIAQGAFICVDRHRRFTRRALLFDGVSMGLSVQIGICLAVRGAPQIDQDFL